MNENRCLKCKSDKIKSDKLYCDSCIKLLLKEQITGVEQNLNPTLSELRKMLEVEQKSVIALQDRTNAFGLALDCRIKDIDLLLAEIKKIE